MTHAQERTSGDAAEANRRERLVTDQTLASFAGAPPRLREVMESLVRHMHSFVRETRLTEQEWNEGIEFLTAAGHITTPVRQEFVLLSDVLGVSMLTIAVNTPPDGAATEATVFGPFFVADSPAVELGGDIAGEASGEPCWVTGTVRDTSGQPVAGARIEVWEADSEGMYDVQYPNGHLAGRAHMFTDELGRYRFWGLTPTPYPLPGDGPVGRLLSASARSPMRASHLHFMITAEGTRRLVTHIFVSGDPYLESDAVFGVKDSLTYNFARHEAGAPTPDGRPVHGTWSSVEFDIVLASALSRSSR